MIRILLILFLAITTTIRSQTNLLKKVDSLLYQGNYTLALSELEFSKLQNFEILDKKGTIYKQVGNYSKAIIAYEKALLEKPTIKTQENLGVCYQKTQRVEKAIKTFLEVLKKNPDNLLLKYHLAKLYKTKKKHTKAKNLFLELIERDSTNANYYYHLGKSYLYLKDKDSSKLNFLKAIEIDKEHFKSLFHLAKIFRIKDMYKKLKLKRFKKINNDTSYSYIAKGLKYYPNNTSFNLLAAKYHFSDEEYEEAIKYFTALEYLDRDSKQKLGVSYYHNKKNEKAKDQFYNLIDKNKADSQTYLYLGLIYKNEKNFDHAELYIKKAIQEEKPQLTQLYFNLGLVYQESKQLKKAITNFKLALAEFKYNWQAQYHLALTCDSFYKDKTIALQHYEAYLKRFSYRDKETKLFVKHRIKELTHILFMEEQ